MDKDTFDKATAGDYQAIATLIREWREVFNWYHMDDYEVCGAVDQMKTLANALDPAKGGMVPAPTFCTCPPREVARTESWEHARTCPMRHPLAD